MDYLLTKHFVKPRFKVSWFKIRVPFRFSGICTGKTTDQTFCSRNQHFKTTVLQYLDLKLSIQTIRYLIYFQEISLPLTTRLSNIYHFYFFFETCFNLFLL